MLQEKGNILGFDINDTKASTWFWAADKFPGREGIVFDSIIKKFRLETIPAQFVKMFNHLWVQFD